MGSKVDVKVVLLGKHSVGKTCLVERYLHGKFKDSTVATVGAAFGAKKLNVGGKEVTLGIWDTAGQERYESMSRIYYRSAKATIVCFDLTDSKSFDKVKFWVDELLQSEEGCDIYVIGTKLDLVKEGTERGRSAQEVKEFATKISAKVFETSSKTGEGIEELFRDIAETYVGKLSGNNGHQQETSKVKVSNVGGAVGGGGVGGGDENKGKGKSCCG